MSKLDIIEKLKSIPEKNSKRVFLIDSMSGNEITFEGIHISALKLGTFFLSCGLKKGDRVAIILNNSTELVKFYFGALYYGLVIVPINPILNKQETEYIINHSKVKMILISNETKEKIDLEYFKEKQIKIFYLKQQENENILEKNIVDIDKLKILHTYKAFENINQDSDIAIVYTSGTTAEPKGVIHKISDFFLNGLGFGEIVGLNHENRFYNLLSLTYLGGFFNLLFLPYINECSVVLSKTFDAKSIFTFWKLISKHKVNTLWLVPSIISIILELDRDNEGISYASKNIKFILSGTAPLPIQIRKNFEERYKVKIYENYGMTESLFISANIPMNEVNDFSVGRTLPSVQVRVVNDENLQVFNEEGKIQIKTPYLMEKYVDNKIRIEKFDGWFDTGDVGYVSTHNEIFLTGRKKDLIIRGGINISPAAIENILYKHPDIRECAVIGIPHKFQGEEIIAVVSIRNQKEFNIIKKEILELTKSELSSIKQPSQIILLPELPHTSTGKIQKSKIRTWFIESPHIEYQKIESQLIKPKVNKKIFNPSKIVKKSIQALSIKFNNLVYEMQRNDEDIIVLSLGEAFFDIPLYSFKDLPFPKIYHYSHSKGIPELREKLSKYFEKNYDVVFDSKTEILITAGSKAAIHMSLMTLIDPGDEVIIHEPAWVSFPEQIKLCYGVPIQIPYNKTVYDFEDYISEKTKVIIVNNPNNPTGRIFNLEEMSYIYNLAKKYNLFVISDEAYSDFVLNKDEFISFANLDIKKRHTIVINSISKNFGISGWRIGYMISNADLINQTLKINQHLITCPATILEYYVEKHFEDILKITKPQIVGLINKRKNVQKYLDAIGLKYMEGNSTFYFFVSIENSTLSSEDFSTELLNEYKVSTAPGIGYGKSCDTFIRISIGSESIDRIITGLKSIKELISKTSK